MTDIVERLQRATEAGLTLTGEDEAWWLVHQSLDAIRALRAEVVRLRAEVAANEGDRPRAQNFEMMLRRIVHRHHRGLGIDGTIADTEGLLRRWALLPFSAEFLPRHPSRRSRRATRCRRGDALRPAVASG